MIRLVDFIRSQLEYDIYLINSVGKTLLVENFKALEEGLEDI